MPLGIAPPKNIQDKIDALPPCAGGTTTQCKENASLGAFRLEVSLPGNMVDSLVQSNNELRLAVESERVAGAITEQTPDGFPRAHLRRSRRDGSAEASSRAATNFKMTRIVPEDLKTPLRTQRGYNRFISPGSSPSPIRAPARIPVERRLDGPAEKGCRLRGLRPSEVPAGRHRGRRRV